MRKPADGRFFEGTTTAMAVEQLRRRQRHERILDAALGVIAQKGYQRAAVEEIALASQTSKGGLYFHFPTKQAILLALLDRLAVQLRARIHSAIAAEPDPIARVDIALQVVLHTFASHRTFSHLFFVEAQGGGDRQVAQRMAAIRASFIGLLQDQFEYAVRQGAIPPLDARVASRVWFGALNEVISDWVLTEPSTNLEDSYPTLRALLLRSVGAQVSSRTRSESAAPAPIDGRGADGSLAPASGRWSADELVSRLEPLLAEAHRRAAQLGRPVLASLALPVPAVDPLAFFERGQQLAEDRLLWTCPRTGYAMVGVDAGWVVESDTSDRFGNANGRWQALQTEAALDLPAMPPTGVGPVLMGGFAFDPLRPRTGLWDGFPATRLVLPGYLLTCADGATWLTVNHIAAPDAPVVDAADAGQAAASLLEGSVARDAPLAGAAPKVEDALSAAEWKTIVAGLARQMRAGRVEKVVLARECQLTAEQPFDLVGALDRLRSRFPSCFVFAIGRGRQCFMGATPERLVRLRDGMVSTMCLAGSIARGATEDEDRRLGEALLNSQKDRAEHEVVVRTLGGMLGELCNDRRPSTRRCC